MESASKIPAASFTEAIAVVEQYPLEYQLQNQWLIDIDHRIKHFFYNEQEIVSKRSTLHKSHQERNRADLAQRILAGAHIGNRAVVAAIPDIVTSGNGENCHLISPFLGADMNESYYARKQPELPFEDWQKLVYLMVSKGIRHRDFLPRNTIITPEQIILIDWENARFDTGACRPDNSTWASLAIGWSYFYDLYDIKSLRKRIGTEENTSNVLNDYENTFAHLTGAQSSHKTISELVCNMAVEAEAQRAYGPLQYKLDDAFHVISEVIPSNIEALMDMMLATRNNTDHEIMSKHIAAVLASFHEAFVANNAGKELTLFKRRCAQLAWMLASPDVLPGLHFYDSELMAVDAIELPDTKAEIEKILATTITSNYPGAQPINHALQAVANELHTLFKADY